MQFNDKTNKISAFIITFLFFTMDVYAGDKLPAPFKIIPDPVKVELGEGVGLNFGDLKLIRLQGINQRPITGNILSQLIERGADEKGVLTLTLTTTGPVPESSEGYLLFISDGNVKISSAGEAGLFYGCQTLEQLLEDSRDTGAVIPACKIMDYPVYSFRAVHFDVKHHLDHMNYYYDSIDRLARYKINAIIFEFEDKLRYKRRPVVGAPQAISIDEMAALTQYARDRFIEINPLVQGLGHATFILKHPEFIRLRELKDNHWAFCPMDEGTYEVLYDLYLDAMEATPGSRYLHIGGDEIGNIGLCHRCKDYAEKEGMFALNLYWLNRVCKFVVEHGRVPIYWDDMPFKYADLWETVHRGQDQSEEEAAKAWEKGLPVLNDMIENFPQKAIPMNWNYRMTRYPGNFKAMEWYRSLNRKVMIATSTQTTTGLMPSADRVQTIKTFIELANEYDIVGILCTAWDDASPHMETYWRGFIAAAEYSWAPNHKSLNDFMAAFFQREFGIDRAGYETIFDDLYRTAVFWYNGFFPQGTRKDSENALQDFPEIAHWRKPSNSTQKERINFEDKLIGLPDLSRPGSWSEKYKKMLVDAQSEALRYERTSVKLTELLRKAKRNRYHWQIFEAINNFQVTMPQLLLALQMCDVGNRDQQKAGFERVKAVLETFETSWSNLQQVFTKTRFIAYPDNYVPDRYFHFASQREDLSFMIQVEELYHKMVREWLAKYSD